jgi:hypothetical protein
MIRASSGASVELYEAGSKKFETTSTGVSVIGGGTFAGNVTAEKSTFSSAATSAWITTIRNSAATGSSYGLTIEAGTNASDLALAVRSKAVVDLMVVRGDGNVGIGTGTDSPSSKLHIRTGTNNNYEFEEVSGELRFSALNDARSANVPLQFAASEFNFISGNVGIGTDTPLANLSVKASNTTGSIIEAAVLDGGGAAAEDGVSLGFTGFNTSTYPNWRYGSISGVYEEINSFKGALVFKTSTAQDGGTERMRITSGGNTQLSGNNLDIKGTSSGNTSVRINAITGTAGTNSLDLINDGTAAYIWNRASTPILFGIGGTERMRITSGGEVDIVGTVKSGGNQRFGAGPGHGNSSSPGITTKANGTAGVYWNADGSGGWGGGNFTTNNSDRNMKTNIVPMDIDALKIIDSLETKYFNWTEKANRGDTSIRKAGIIAQDLKELMPEGVYGAEWKDDDKESNGLSLDENATTALLIKAIQELKAEVDLLKQNCNCKN